MSLVDLFYNNYMIVCCIIFLFLVNHFFKSNLKNFILFISMLCLLCLCCSIIESNRTIYYLKHKLGFGCNEENDNEILSYNHSDLYYEINK
jgi:hypothetical protein